MDDATIVKIDEEKRRVFGWAYVAKRADGTQVVDHSGDVVDTPEALQSLEDAFYRYVLDSRSGDDQHVDFGVSKLIESVWISPEKAEAMGLPTEVPTGQWVGYEFDRTPEGDQAWGRVKKRERNMFSIVGAGGYPNE